MYKQMWWIPEEAVWNAAGGRSPLKGLGNFTEQRTWAGSLDHVYVLNSSRSSCTQVVAAICNAGQLEFLTMIMSPGYLEKNLHRKWVEASGSVPCDMWKQSSAHRLYKNRQQAGFTPQAIVCWPLSKTIAIAIQLVSVSTLAPAFCSKQDWFSWKGIGWLYFPAYPIFPSSLD